MIPGMKVVAAGIEKSWFDSRDHLMIGSAQYRIGRAQHWQIAL